MNEETRNKLHSSGNDEWITPPDVYKQLDEEFHFTLDPCATKVNYRHENYFTKADNGLMKSWKKHTVFMNPPYSKADAWMQKAYEESKLGATVVCLMASRTSAKWFHNYAMNGEIRFIKGRLNFYEDLLINGEHKLIRKKDGAPFGSIVVIFKRNFVLKSLEQKIYRGHREL